VPRPLSQLSGVPACFTACHPPFKVYNFFWVFIPRQSWETYLMVLRRMPNFDVLRPILGLKILPSVRSPSPVHNPLSSITWAFGQNSSPAQRCLLVPSTRGVVSGPARPPCHFPRGSSSRPNSGRADLPQHPQIPVSRMRQFPVHGSRTLLWLILMPLELCLFLFLRLRGLVFLDLRGRTLRPRDLGRAADKQSEGDETYLC
jgi:hypothetical protein